MSYSKKLFPPECLIQDCGYKTPCWIWQRQINADGYGVACPGGRHVTKLAHRWYYERFVEPIPDGYEVDHLCRIESCVNPEHLEAVTPAENTRRRTSTKLTIADVLEIRKARENGVLLRIIASRYKISVSAAWDAATGDTWAGT